MIFSHHIYIFTSVLFCIISVQLVHLPKKKVRGLYLMSLLYVHV